MTRLSSILSVISTVIATAIRPSFPGQDSHLQIPVQETSSSDSVAIFRPLRDDDLDDLVTVYLDAFHSSAIHRYLTLNTTHDMTHYTRHCTRQDFLSRFAKGGEDMFANVISVPVDDKSDPESFPSQVASSRRDGRSLSARRERVVSFAIWQWLRPNSTVKHSIDSLLLPSRSSLQDKIRSVSERQSRVSSDQGENVCSERRDLNMTRVVHVREWFTETMNHYTNNVTTPRLYLALLATHPEWDGNGFGARQVRSGLDRARGQKRETFLLSTPAGYPLYDGLGFSSVKNLTFEMLDHLGTLWLEYMTHAPV